MVFTELFGSFLPMIGRWMLGCLAESSRSIVRTSRKPSCCRKSLISWGYCLAGAVVSNLMVTAPVILQLDSDMFNLFAQFHTFSHGPMDEHNNIYDEHLMTTCVSQLGFCQFLSQRRMDLHFQSQGIAFSASWKLSTQRSRSHGWTESCEW